MQGGLLVVIRRWQESALGLGSELLVSASHSDLKRPDMLADINNRQTTESISVVSVSIESVSSGHLVVKNNLTRGYWFSSQVRQKSEAN